MYKTSWFLRIYCNNTNKTLFNIYLASKVKNVRSNKLILPCKFYIIVLTNSIIENSPIFQDFNEIQIITSLNLSHSYLFYNNLNWLLHFSTLVPFPFTVLFVWVGPKNQPPTPPQKNTQNWTSKILRVSQHLRAEWLSGKQGV